MSLDYIQVLKISLKLALYVLINEYFVTYSLQRNLFPLSYPYPALKKLVFYFSKTVCVNSLSVVK